MGDSDLDEITALLIDGNNLLHRRAGNVEEGSQRLLLAKLRGAVPPTLACVLRLDGHSAAGTGRREKIGRGLEVRHAGSISADDALVRLIVDTPFNERAGITVVTDDRSLTERARHAGAHTQRLAWLERLLDGPTPTRIGAGNVGSPHDAGRRPNIGAGRPPRPNDDTTTPGDDERPPWTPGRGATRKRGNPRRRPR